jgi:hypothetical protein
VINTEKAFGRGWVANGLLFVILAVLSVIWMRRNFSCKPELAQITAASRRSEVQISILNAQIRTVKRQQPAETSATSVFGSRQQIYEFLLNTAAASGLRVVRLSLTTAAAKSERVAAVAELSGGYLDMENFWRRLYERGVGFDLAKFEIRPPPIPGDSLHIALELQISLAPNE